MREYALCLSKFSVSQKIGVVVSGLTLINQCVENIVNFSLMSGVYPEPLKLL